jgi:hypothetical protein
MFYKISLTIFLSEFQDLTDNLIRGTDELKQRIEDDKKEMVEKLEGETTVIKARIETVKEESKNEAQRLEGEMTKGKESLSERLRKENEEIQCRMKRDAEERAKREIDMKAGNNWTGQNIKIINHNIFSASTQNQNKIIKYEQQEP